ncbi:hypothetical protein IWZ01DRAFT_26550 [Phyllosticta capitalensis]
MDDAVESRRHRTLGGPGLTLTGSAALLPMAVQAGFGAGSSTLFSFTVRCLQAPDGTSGQKKSDVIPCEISRHHPLDLQPFFPLRPLATRTGTANSFHPLTAYVVTHPSQPHCPFRNASTFSGRPPTQQPPSQKCGPPSRGPRPPGTLHPPPS